MGRKPRPVRHLQDRDGRFYARLAVPVELREIIGKRELLEPLGVSRSRAIAALHGVVARFQAILDEARQGIPPDPSPVSPRRAARDHYASEMAMDDATAGPGRFVSRAFNECAADPYIANLQRVAALPAAAPEWRDDDAKRRREMVAARLAQLRPLAIQPADEHQAGDPFDIAGKSREALLSSIALLQRELEARDSFVEATVGHAITAACQAQGVPRPSPGSPAYQALAQALAAAQLEAMQRSRERDAGKFDGKPFYEPLRGRKDEPPELAPLSIEGLLDTYLTMRARSGVGAESRKRWHPCSGALSSSLAMTTRASSRRPTCNDGSIIGAIKACRRRRSTPSSWRASRSSYPTPWRSISCRRARRSS